MRFLNRIFRCKYKPTFTIRTLLIAVILLSFSLVWFVKRVEDQKRAVQWVRNHGGNVSYSSEFNSNGEYHGKSTRPPWLVEFIGIDGLSYVHDVFFSNHELETVEPLRNLKHLKSLYLTSTIVHDYRTIPSLTKLKSLAVFRTSEVDLNLISKSKSIEYLEIDECRANAINIGKMHNLKCLVLARFEFVDLTEIESLSNLERLDLTLSKIESLSPLKKLKSLKAVNLVDVEIVDNSESIEDIRKSLPNCKISMPILGPF